MSFSKFDTDRQSLFAAVDLFCGVGGLTHGLRRAGIDVRAGYDIDPASQYPYVTNNDSEYVLRDVAELTGAEVESWYCDAKYRLLAGCAPCQPFSTYSRATKRQSLHKDWGLLGHFARLIGETNPDFVTMENVPSLAGQSVFREFLDVLSEYKVWWDVLDLSQWGIPQTRKRLVLIASRFSEVRLDLNTCQQISVEDSIGDLPPIGAGETNHVDRMHVAPTLSEMNRQRIRASRPGGTWRDWPVHLLANCHKRQGGATYPSVYGRMEWSTPAPTITTQCYAYGSGRFGHPEQDRAITLREAALLQTFPRDYAFVPEDEPVRFNVLGRLIGNAVPVKLGEIIGHSILASAGS